MFIPRRATAQIEAGLRIEAAVGLLGPRQAGKTTLALQIASSRQSVYLDLERREDREAIRYPRQFIEANRDRLVVLDEVHRAPDLFPELRGIIDDGRRRGRGTGRFLILGSASVPLLRQSESLAGRILYVHLGPLDLLEAAESASPQTLWLRGGLPRSVLAGSDADSLRIRRGLVETYLARDIPHFAPRLAVETMDRLWTMIAHSHGALLDRARLATGLELSAPTVGRYLDLLADLLLVRRLRPFHANVRKRLVKSPKTYMRDSGLLHALLGIRDFNELLRNPALGASWEGFAIETLLAVAPWNTLASFYRTAQGAELDLVLEIPGRPSPWAVEIKYGSPPRLTRGFHIACDDLQPEHAFVVHSGDRRYPIREGVSAIGLAELAALLANCGDAPTGSSFGCADPLGGS